MTIETWLRTAANKLKSTGIGSARLDAELILAEVLGAERPWLLAHGGEALADNQAKADALLKRRLKHEPIAYITGHSEFYGRKFIVNHHVLEPRPETEMMIELLKELAERTTTAVDIGTGSGAIAITAKLELPRLNVIASDISNQALEVASKNTANLGAKIKLARSDLLSEIEDDIDTICANLPYVPDNFQINLAAGHEPRLAIFGGPDGLDLYRRLFDQLKQRRQKPKFILTEALPPQHSQLAEIAASAGYDPVKSANFIQLFKYR